MSIIGLLFAGKPERHPDTGWEPFSNLQISGDLEIAEYEEWGALMARAENMGFFVSRRDGSIYMYRNDNCQGMCPTSKGGYRQARQFLDDVAKNDERRSGI